MPKDPSPTSTAPRYSHAHRLQLNDRSRGAHALSAELTGLLLMGAIAFGCSTNNGNSDLDTDGLGTSPTSPTSSTPTSVSPIAPSPSPSSPASSGPGPAQTVNPPAPPATTPSPVPMGTPPVPSNAGGEGGTSNGEGGTNPTGGSGNEGPNPTDGGTGGAAAGSGGAPLGEGGNQAGDGGSGVGGSSPNGDTPCPTNGDPCKILPLGDSITDGFGVAGGYRIDLFERALEGNYNITFVGGSMNGPDMVAGQAFPRAHEGHSGWTIQQINDIVPSPALNPEPHIILLHIGTNDMVQGANGAEDRLSALLDEIIDASPEALLVVSTIIPLPLATASVDTYNAALIDIVQERIDGGARVLLVDQFTGFPDNELDDGVHPNAAGYARMAGVWFEAIDDYLR